MTERPILFSAPMIRALLAGTKTQTRRVLRTKGTFGLALPDPVSIPGHRLVYGWDQHGPGARSPAVHCPYGEPGDRLWVRENGWERPSLSARDLREGADTWPPYEYDAEPLMCWADGELKGYGWKRRPSIHMPRWASRILLEVTKVRVQRLQEISEADCIAEGCPGGHGAFPGYAYNATPTEHYRYIWRSLHGVHSWDENPWVWAVSFRRLKP